MFAQRTDVFLTALAPIIWGSSYIVATEFLPPDRPLTIAMLRALPTGVILMLILRQFPPAHFVQRLIVLSTLNFALFWSMLFLAAFRLPGGVAATLGAVQPLFVLGFSVCVLKTRVAPLSFASATLGLCGVGMLILGPEAELDLLGVTAALVGAGSMAMGVVLVRKWQPDVSPLTFTAWQLTVGGLMLLPIAMLFEPRWPAVTVDHVIGLGWLGLIGAGATYVLWFRGIQKLGPAGVTGLGFLSPLSAVLLGWVFLEQALSPVQIIGAAVIIASIWLSQRAQAQSSSRRGTMKSLTVARLNRA